jgi:putative addiction module killer protein
MIRKIIAYKNYFIDFLNSLTEQEKKKVFYVLEMLKVHERISTKFIKHIVDGIFELRVEYNGNIYRLFFIFDKENIVVLFNGFQKKSQKTPQNEIEKAKQLKNEYYGNK